MRWAWPFRWWWPSLPPWEPATGSWSEIGWALNKATRATWWWLAKPVPPPQTGLARWGWPWGRSSGAEMTATEAAEIDRSLHPPSGGEGPERRLPGAGWPSGRRIRAGGRHPPGEQRGRGAGAPGGRRRW